MVETWHCVTIFECELQLLRMPIVQAESDSNRKLWSWIILGLSLRQDISIFKKPLVPTCSFVIWLERSINKLYCESIRCSEPRSFPSSNHNQSVFLHKKGLVSLHALFELFFSCGSLCNIFWSCCKFRYENRLVKLPLIRLSKDCLWNRYLHEDITECTQEWMRIRGTAFTVQNVVISPVN